MILTAGCWRKICWQIIRVNIALGFCQSLYIRCQSNMDHSESRFNRLHSKSKVRIVAFIAFTLATISAPIALALGIPVHATELDHIAQIDDLSLPDRSTAACSYLKQYTLPDNARTSVCLYTDRVRLDIRQFVGSRPTIKGIALNLPQFCRFEAFVWIIAKETWHI